MCFQNKLLQENIKFVQCHFLPCDLFYQKLTNHYYCDEILRYKYKLHKLLGKISFFFKVCPKPASNEDLFHDLYSCNCEFIHLKTFKYQNVKVFSST